MAFKPNYKQQRNERVRAKEEKKAKKLQQKQQRREEALAAGRKPEDEGQSEPAAEPATDTTP